MNQHRNTKKPIPLKKTEPTRKKAAPRAVIHKPGGIGNFPPDSKKANRLITLFFFIIAVVLYGNTILNKWAVDDEYVTGPNNETVKLGLKAIPKIFTTNYVSQTGNIGSQNADYRPVVKLTYALEYQLWGGEKAGRSHAINVFIYFIISTLLFFILKRMFKNYNILFPFLITVAFMAHPVHSEVVASLKNRDELLAMLCGLGGLYFMLRYAENNKVRYFLYTLLLFFVGYLCKSSILPFLVIYTLVLYFFTDMKPKRFILITGAIIVVIALAQFVPRLFLPHTTRVNYFIENPLFFEKNFWIRTGTGLMSLLFYLRILLYPYPLVYYYGYNTIPITGWGNIWVLVSFLIYVGLLLYAVSKFREKNILSFSILFFMIAIAMYSNVLFPVVGIVAERFVFIASIGFSIALVYVIFKIFKTEPNSLTIEFNERAKILAIIILLLIPSAYITIKRNRAWRNLYDLCASDVNRVPNSAKVNIQFAGVLMNKIYNAKPQDQEMMIQAYAPVIIRYFKKGLDIYPDNYSTLNDLASVYLNFGSMPDSATIFLKRAIALDPKLQPAWVNLGLAYRQRQKFDSALYCYQKVLDQNPDEMKAVFAMANIYNDLGDMKKAVRMNMDVAKAHPELDTPFKNIGKYYMAKGDTASAVAFWEEAVRKSPSYELCILLHDLYRLKGDGQKAIYYYDLATSAANNGK
jgi:protein O-mannosyl-transferase